MKKCVSVSVLLALGVLLALPARADEAFRAQVEADWLLQERVRTLDSGDVTTQEDAAGACDGVKNGQWGFHTAADQAPWWQVDLGEERPLAAVVVYNRCDGVAARASRIQVLLSSDGTDWRVVHENNGVFHGFTGGPPLRVRLQGEQARYVRLALPRPSFLHLDEVEVFASDEPGRNIALNQPADQSSTSQWSTRTEAAAALDWDELTRRYIEYTRNLAKHLEQSGIDAAGTLAEVTEAAQRGSGEAYGREDYLAVRWLRRELALRNPLLDFDTILFAERVPGSYNHMSDQYYGWWSRPGGGLHLLSGYRSEKPEVRCISEAFTEPGSFLRPMLSYDAEKVVFAWCRHYPDLADEPDKFNKANVPEDAFYHLFEMNIDGTGVRQLTRGKYDDFDARYLPGGRIVFLSTRRDRTVQYAPRAAERTGETPALCDVYVRCGGGPRRPVAVYTLHTVNADGSGLRALSPFEMFEWTPCVDDDGTILYSRWDYVDRDNMPYMGLWSIRPDGTNARIVYANFTKAPHCTFEPRPVPGVNKVVFTASGHHAQTMGSLVLFDPAAGTETHDPIVRLTPEVPFPEIEAWPRTVYANPWPLSERLYLVAWGEALTMREGRHLPPNLMGIYLYDAADRTLELLHRNPEITSAWPIPLKPRTRPPVLADTVDYRQVAQAPEEGRFVVTDVYQGLPNTPRGSVAALRIVAIPAKTHPTMNAPVLGVTRDDPGKCVLGTVPVEPDGSAHFRVPAGVPVFFQALDHKGMAVQTMRSATHAQPGQILSCVGCHEDRHSAPASRVVSAAMREPSRIAVGPAGSWPLRFDELVMPVLETRCAGCHEPGKKGGGNLDLAGSADDVYERLVTYGKPSLRDHVMMRYREGRSTEGGCAAASSVLLAKLSDKEIHPELELADDEFDRLVTWMDTYAQRLGSFDEEQERELTQLRRQWAPMLVERRLGAQTAALAPSSQKKD